MSAQCIVGGHNIMGSTAYRLKEEQCGSVHYNTVLPFLYCLYYIACIHLLGYVSQCGWHDRLVT
jgi:hypothetical protein